MLDVRLACPRCARRLKTTEPPAVGQRFRCPRCNHSFAVQANDFHPASTSSLAVPVAQPYAPPPQPAAPVAVTPPPVARVPELLSVPEPIPEPAGSGKVLLTVAAVAGLFLAGGIGLALALSSGGKKDEDSSTRTADSGDRDADKGDKKDQPSDKLPKQDDRPPGDRGKQPPARDPQDPRSDPGRKKDPPRPDDPPIQRPRPPTPPPVQVAALPPEEQAKVDKAIEKGVQFLKKQQHNSGSWAGNNSALAALPALTLLECGVPADDPVIKKAADFVRKAVRHETQTYHLALMILFLDRLGDRRDRRLIQTLALRLAAGQQPSGGWTYGCPLLDDKETEDLFAYLHRERPRDPLQLFEQDRGDASMQFFVSKTPGQTGTTGTTGRFGEATVGQGDDPKKPGTIPQKGVDRATLPFDELPSRKIPREKLPVRVKDLPVVKPLPSARDLPPSDVTDNSNTQFAILGVWAAGRHAVPMERTLALLVKRFRKSQNTDGGWGYRFSTSGNSGGTPAMTCSGLLGLAVGHGLIAGASPSSRPSGKDPAIQKGLEALAKHIGKPLGAPIEKPGKKPARRAGRPLARAAINLYFLWSVERVGVLYNLRTIAEKDWYQWGAELLVDNQDSSGGWHCGGYHGSTIQTDTCFALLFLKRANLTRDLSQKLEFLIDVRESK
ncbi:MAG TPA: hypothetical protein VKD72_11175 [Gemmataceae bacterium]|nr:hypothetical protein [Gemmataceae bacterium]